MDDISDLIEPQGKELAHAPDAQRYREFARAWVRTENAAFAYREAGYAPDRANAARMLRHPTVKKYIEEYQAELAAQVKTDAAHIVQRIAETANLPIGSLFEPETGKLLPPNEMPIEAQRAIVSVDVEQGFDSETGAVTNQKAKVKLESRLGAWRLLAQFADTMRGDFDPTPGGRPLLSEKEMEIELGKFFARVQHRLSSEQKAPE